MSMNLFDSQSVAWAVKDPSDKLVALALAGLAVAQSIVMRLYPIPLVQELSKKTGLSEDQVEASVQRLVDGGTIAILMDKFVFFRHGRSDEKILSDHYGSLEVRPTRSTVKSAVQRKPKGV